jgi:CheY-like chemotaxis protein/HPt (histidine-containing phosphotransfer) domain-containing protein
MGSTFWFTVRLAKPPAETLVNAAAIPCLADLRGVRALIVDDNPINRQILSKRLATWDMRVFACNDGPDAFLALGEAVDEGDPFNIAIIDMQMPGMSGEVLGRMIKADRRFAGVKLVMMTSTGMRGDARRSREIGFSAYLLKPVNLNLLADALGMVLSEKDADGGTGSTVTRHLIRESERSRIRILLAEDNATNQQVALSMFKKLGFPAVDLVETGNEVLAALAQKTYSMVFMDVQMPEMDGLQATKCIRDVSSASVQHDIPIIAMTAHAMQGDREKCLAAGMNDYITKPIALKALAEAVNRWRKPGYREDGNRSADNTGDGKEVSAIFNYASLLERMMGDSKLAREILRTFLEDLPVHIEKLKTTIVSRDKPGIASQAHSLRGAVANIGGDLLSSVAAELERAGTGGDLALVKSSFAELEKQSELLCEEIQGTLGIETNRRRD